MQQIGFIGIGVMGERMARNLMKTGFSLSVYTRTKAKAEALLAEGAQWCESAAACAQNRDAVITIVGYPRDVEAVYFGEGGVIANAAPGTVLIDMTTTSPALSKRIAEAAAANGLDALDAPVSGGDTGALKGTLSIMVGGAKAAFDKCLPLFQAMGTNIVYEGEAGSGQHTKMANQIALTGALAGVCEALAYAKNAGLDPQRMLDSISAGAAGSWQMSNMAPRMLAGNFDPGFFIKHYIKDMKIATAEGDAVGAPLPVSKLVLAMFEALSKLGMDELGTQALYRYYTE